MTRSESITWYWDSCSFFQVQLRYITLFPPITVLLFRDFLLSQLYSEVRSICLVVIYNPFLTFSASLTYSSTDTLDIEREVGYQSLPDTLSKRTHGASPVSLPPKITPPPQEAAEALDSQNAADSTEATTAATAAPAPPPPVFPPP